MGDRIAAARLLWLDDRPLDAAALLARGLAPEVVVAWAAAICEPSLRTLPADLADDARVALSEPGAWRTANLVFSRVRAYALEDSNVVVRPIEHALKLAFNASGSEPPFDDRQFERLVLSMWKSSGIEGRPDAWALVTASAPWHLAEPEGETGSTGS